MPRDNDQESYEQMHTQPFDYLDSGFESILGQRNEYDNNFEIVISSINLSRSLIIIINTASECRNISRSLQHGSKLF